MITCAEDSPGFPRHDALAFVAAVVGFGCFYTLFFLKSLLSGDHIAPSDSLDFGLASFLARPTLWTDAMYSGYPIAADPQALTWYPPLRLLQAVGAPWNVFMILPYVVASATTFLLVRRLTRSDFAAVFGGGVFGFSGVFLAHISHFNQIHAAAWLPLVVYALQRCREGNQRSGILLGSAAGALMITAGHPQNVVYGVYVCAGLVTGWIFIDRVSAAMAGRRLAAAAAMFALAVGLAAILVVPMLELAEYSRRADSSWNLYIDKALPAWQLLSLALPLSFGGFRTSPENSVEYIGAHSPLEMTGYVGLLPLVLALSAPILAGGFRRESALWLTITAIAALLCLGAATPLAAAFFHAPGYGRFRVPARHLFVVSFALAICAAIVFAELLRRRDRRLGLSVATAAVLLSAGGALWYLAQGTPAVRTLIATNQMYVQWALWLPMMVGVGFVVAGVCGHFAASGRSAQWAFAAVLITMHLADMTAFHYVAPGYVLEYAEVPEARVTPHPRVAELTASLQRTRGRILAADGSRNWFLLPNLTRAWNVPAAGGTGSLAIERFAEMLRMGGPGDVNLEIFEHRHLALDMFSVEYVMIPIQWLTRLTTPLDESQGWIAVEELHFAESNPDTHYWLYRNTRAHPRAWCASRLVHANADQTRDIVRTGLLPSGEAFLPGEMALAEPAVLPTWPNAGAAERAPKVHIAISSDGARRYSVSAEAPCLLVLSEVYYPWWRASINGTPVKPSRVNHAMVGIPMPPGEHIVRLWLTPTSVYLGAALSGVTAFVWLALAAYPKIRRPTARSRRPERDN